MNYERDVTGIAPDIALQTIYEASLTREGGFMPPVVPLDRVPASFAALDLSLAELGERYVAPDAAVRPWLDELYGAYDPTLDAEIDRMTRPELDKLMTALSLLCHAYRWNSNPATPAACALSRITLPEGLRAPWTRVAQRLRCRRVGTLYSVVLSNFRVPCRPGGSEYRNEDLVGENLELAYNWLLPPHACELRAFLMTFIEVEARGAVAVRVIVPLIQAALREDAPEVSRRLASTGRMVAPEQDRIAVFSRLMDERRQETADALLVAEPGVLQSAAA